MSEQQEFESYIEYHQSINAELLASRNRVRHFIGTAHNGEDGRYKEILLMNYLKKVLPSNVSVGTGFVSGEDGITKQIDIIIYNHNIPTLFSEGDFVIVLPESVIGIIEVKTKLNISDLIEAIQTSHENGVKIKRSIFNGIFCFETGINFDRFSDNYSDRKYRLREVLTRCGSQLNHISIGSEIFIKYWKDENPAVRDGIPAYSFYDLKALSFGFFVSNLIEFIHSTSSGLDISDNLRNFLYPTQKEISRIVDLEVKMLDRQ
ncbi:DUF6602 domain-containing protein [Planomicrobium okeanokoites]|uniref:DUF6602 domain-containing protein n=1 Tax=Planomicrobium okeanokoites TaxID=244 RepID=UPI002491ED5C|nr:DUF6602 domain-containing protein [Planomicrobium okeanokoites]